MTMRRFKERLYDSTFTHRGTLRKNIYPTSGENGKEAKKIAMEDFHSQKQPLFKVEKISPFKRHTGLIYDSYLRDTIPNHQLEIRQEREEYAEAAFYYMRYIL